MHEESERNPNMCGRAIFDQILAKVPHFKQAVFKFDARDGELGLFSYWSGSLRQNAAEESGGWFRNIETDVYEFRTIDEETDCDDFRTLDEEDEAAIATGEAGYEDVCEEEVGAAVSKILDSNTGLLIDALFMGSSSAFSEGKALTGAWVEVSVVPQESSLELEDYDGRVCTLSEGFKGFSASFQTSVKVSAATEVPSEPRGGPESCPYCNSQDIIWKSKANQWECSSCEERFAGDMTAVVNDQVMTYSGSVPVSAEYAGSEDHLMITEEVARRYLRNPSEVEIESFTSITDAAAFILSENDAEVDSLCGQSISLSGLTSLSDASARALAQFRGTIFLQGLTDLSDRAAKEFSKHRDGSLYLDGLTTLSPTAAESLAQGAAGSSLSLSGVTSLSAESASALGAHRGFQLSLNGVKSLPDESAEALALHQGRCLELDGLNSLSETCALAFSRHKGNLSLGGLTSVSEKVAVLLGRHDGSLLLDGLNSMNAACARALARHKVKTLSLDGLTSLSDDVALALARHEGSGLSLNGITSLSEGAALALASYKGESLSLDGIVALPSERSAKALARHEGVSLLGLDASSQLILGTGEEDGQAAPSDEKGNESPQEQSKGGFPMFGFFQKKNLSPEERATQVAQKLLAQVNDCSNDIRVMWKRKDPCELFPETMRALSEAGGFLSAQGGGPFSSWNSKADGFGWGDQASTYDKGAITSLIENHLEHIVKILDKHAKECAAASAPEAHFLADFASHVCALRGSIMIEERLAFIHGLVEQIQTQAPLDVDDCTRLDGATNDGVRTITYNYSLLEHKLPAGIDLKAARRSMKDAQLKVVAGDEDLKKMVQFGAQLQYVYAGRNGRVLIEYLIRRQDLLC